MGGGGKEQKKKQKKREKERVKPGVGGGEGGAAAGTCASLAISKPRLMRQALNSSAPRVPEWSWGWGGQCRGVARGGGATGHAAHVVGGSVGE